MLQAPTSAPCASAVEVHGALVAYSLHRADPSQHVVARLKQSRRAVENRFRHLPIRDLSAQKESCGQQDTKESDIRPHKQPYKLASGKGRRGPMSRPEPSRHHAVLGNDNERGE